MTEARSILTPRKDFTIGLRGGDWYAFGNNRRARDAIRERRIPLSFGIDQAAAIHAVEAMGFSWELEP